MDFKLAFVSVIKSTLVIVSLPIVYLLIYLLASFLDSLGTHFLLLLLSIFFILFVLIFLSVFFYNLDKK